MSIILGLAGIGLVIGIIFACIEGDFAYSIGLAIFGAIAGAVLTVLISIGVWIFAPEGAYINEPTEYLVQSNDAGELMYFEITHDESTTYLYYMDNNQEIQKMRLSNASVQFIEDGQQTRIEKYEWKYKSEILTHIAFRPLTKCGTSIVIHISEEDWLRHTDGGTEHVITHAAESN